MAVPWIPPSDRWPVLSGASEAAIMAAQTAVPLFGPSAGVAFRGQGFTDLSVHYVLDAEGLRVIVAWHGARVLEVYARDPATPSEFVLRPLAPATEWADALVAAVADDSPFRRTSPPTVH